MSKITDAMALVDAGVPDMCSEMGVLRRENAELRQRMDNIGVWKDCEDLERRVRTLEDAIRSSRYWQDGAKKAEILERALNAKP